MMSLCQLVISDIHAGRWGKGESLNEVALYAFFRYANKKQAEVVINGDFDDHLLYSCGELDNERYRRQLRTFTDSLRIVENSIRFLRGNHDPRILNLFYQPNSDVLITHGHIFETDAIHSIQKDTKEDALRYFNDNLLHFEKQYDDNFERIDKYIHPLMCNLRKRFLPMCEYLEGSFFPRILSYRKDNDLLTNTAAEVVYKIGAKVAIIGHNHISGISTRKVEDQNILVGNSGSWIGHTLPRNAIFIDSEKLQLLQYSPTDGEVEVKVEENYSIHPKIL